MSEDQVSDRQTLQKIIDEPGSTAQERMKAVELKARLDGKIGHGGGGKRASEMTRVELEDFVAEARADLVARKLLASVD